MNNYISPFYLISQFCAKYLKEIIKIIWIISFLICQIKINEYISNIITNKYNKEFRVCLCTLGKEENKYIREFLDHYINYGVDKIYLYDNNNFDGERFEEKINDYIEKGYVQLLNFRGKKRAAYRIMNNCYRQNYKYYNWLIFFEIDEFIYLKDFKNIKYFLNNSRFDKCQKVQLNWKFHTDNNLLYYDNRTLKERFTELPFWARGVKKGGQVGIKTILRGHIPNVKINCVHTLNKNLKACNGFGVPQKYINIVTDISDYEYYYIDHYYCKSTEEFINKLKRGDIVHKDNRMDRIKTYFSQNLITKEKIDLIENRTGLNLSIFRNLIRKQNL